MKRILAVSAAALAMVLLISGCSAGSGSNAKGPCVEGWTAAVLWSSETAGRSEVAFVGDFGVLERRTWKFQGLEAVPNQWFRSGSDVWLVANGNPVRDRTDVLRFSTTSCELQFWRVPEPAVWSVVRIDDSFVTTNNLNGASWLHRRTMDGEVVAEQSLEGINLTTLVAADDRLYALGADFNKDDEGLLLELDPKSLQTIRRVDLAPMTSSVPGAVVKEGRLYYPVNTVTGDREGQSLGVVSLDDFTHFEVPLESPSPYLLADGGDVLFVGHTFMNPGYREMAEYRFVSRYHLGSGEVETFEVGGPLLAMEVTGSKLVVLTGEESSATVKTFDTDTMELLSSIEVDRPAGTGYFYQAGLILP